MTRNAWGARYFAPSPEQRLGDLPLSQDAASLLQSIGLPTGPPAALQLCLRFETVNITHRPAARHLLIAAGLEIGPAFPRTGQPELDTWIDLRNFVVLGEVPNDSEPGPWFRTRLLCVDGTRGNVCWVYQALSSSSPRIAISSTAASPATSVHCWRISSFARSGRHCSRGIPTMTRRPPLKIRRTSQCEIIHQQFLARLQAADPSSFKGGFWENHAWNESILMHS